MTTPSSLWLYPFLLSLGGCLTGCIPSTERLAGFSTPAMEGHWGGGKWFKIGTNFTGDATMKRDAETGEIQEFAVHILSDAGAIYDAQGRRVITADLAGLRRDNYAFQLEALQKITDGVTNLAGTLITAGLARGGGEGQSMVSRGMSLLDQIGPLLGGLQGGTGLDNSAMLAALLELLKNQPPPVVVVPTTQPTQ